MKLRDYMQAVTADMFGVTFAFSQDYPGIDDFMSNPKNRIEGYVHLRGFPPYSKGFNHQSEKFRRRVKGLG